MRMCQNVQVTCAVIASSHPIMLTGIFLLNAMRMIDFKKSPGISSSKSQDDVSGSSPPSLFTR